jgi:hypothetical protein
MLALIKPVRLAEPFDHADWVFEAKFDGFRAAADTVRGRLLRADLAALLAIVQRIDAATHDKHAAPFDVFDPGSDP